MPVRTKLVAMDKIVHDAGTQVRVEMDDEALEKYIELIKQNADMPPVVVFKDRTGKHFLADGFHRYIAHSQVGNPEMRCEIHSGTARDALKYALKANETHGVPRSQRDRRAAVRICLRDPVWQKLSNYRIAEMCAVSEPMVRRLRKQLEKTGEIEEREEIEVVRGGKKQKQKPKKRKPSASKTQIDEPREPVRRRRTQEEANRDDFIGGLRSARTALVLGPEDSVRTWGCDDWEDELVNFRDDLSRMIVEIRRSK